MTLTDRYVAATLRSVPADARDDIDRELRGSITDAVDAKVEAGTEPAAAEVAVLTDLGDPDRLAAGLAGRSLYLIGPELFLGWRRLLKGLLWIALLPGIAVLALDIIDGSSAGAAIGGAVWSTVMVALQIAFWTTLVYAVLERSGRRRENPAGAWSVDNLPDTDEDRGISLVETVFSVGVALILIVAALLQREFSAYRDAGGAPIQMLDVDLWSFWMPALLGVLGLTIVLDIAKYAIGRWTTVLAAVNTVLNILFVVPLMWLATSGRLFEAAYFDAEFPGDGTEAMRLFTQAVIAIAVVVAAWEVGAGWLKVLRSPSRTGLPPLVGAH